MAAIPRPRCLVVGLGNPGATYASTRHNAGFMVVDKLAAKHKIEFARWKGPAEAHLGQGIIHERPVLLLKPHTYMNLSGMAVRAVVNQFKVPPADILIVYDDLFTSPGWVKLRPNGRSGGHNGMENIIHQLATEQIPRLKLGIGEPPAGTERERFVLGTFTRNEQPLINEAVDRAVATAEIWLKFGMDKAMTEGNARTAAIPSVEDLLRRQQQRKTHVVATRPSGRSAKKQRLDDAGGTQRLPAASQKSADGQIPVGPPGHHGAEKPV